MELSAELLFVLGLTTTLAVWVLRELFIKQGKEVPKYVYNIILGAVALVLSFAFAPVVLPPFPSHDGSLIGILSASLTYVGLLLPTLVAVVGFAKIIYEDLLERVLKGLGQQIRAAWRGGSAGDDIG